MDLMYRASVTAALGIDPRFAIARPNLSSLALVTKIGDRLSITAEGKSFLAYRVFFGDTMKKEL
jgi:hypothetical protein